MPQGKQILWYVSMALYSTYFRHVLYEWEWISLNLLAWAVQVCAYNWQSQQVLCVNDNFFYIEISWCEKFFSVFCFFFFPNVDVCNLEYDICLQWDGFGLFLVIDMSMNSENRLSKVVSEWSLYGMCLRSGFLIRVFVLHSAALKELWSHLVALSSTLLWCYGAFGLCVCMATAGLCSLPFSQQLGTNADTIGKLVP